MGLDAGSGTEFSQERGRVIRRQKVAVDCWFTSTGRTLPRMIKYEDADGCLQMIRDIRIVKQDQKNYVGIYCQQFSCRAVVDGREWEFLLLFHSKDHTWDMVFSP